MAQVQQSLDATERQLQSVTLEVQHPRVLSMVMERRQRHTRGPCLRPRILSVVMAGTTVRRLGLGLGCGQVDHTRCSLVTCGMTSTLVYETYETYLSQMFSTLCSLSRSTGCSLHCVVCLVLPDVLFRITAGFCLSYVFCYLYSVLLIIIVLPRVAIPKNNVHSRWENQLIYNL